MSKSTKCKIINLFKRHDFIQINLLFLFKFKYKSIVLRIQRSRQTCLRITWPINVTNTLYHLFIDCICKVLYFSINFIFWHVYMLCFHFMIFVLFWCNLTLYIYNNGTNRITLQLDENGKSQINNISQIKI